jgi:hypothetical protein
LLLESQFLTGKVEFQNLYRQPVGVSPHINHVLSGVALYDLEVLTPGKPQAKLCKGNEHGVQMADLQKDVQ